jgi:predicted glutamine amidotransferase
MFERFSEDAIVVVSEPLNEIVEYWEEIQESTVVTVDGLQVETRTFKPQRPG